MAKIHFKYGAMNSGKSDVLIKTAYNYCENGLDVITIKPSAAAKGGDYITARCGSKRKINILATPKTDIRQAVKDYVVKNKPKSLSCILVDEAQFLTIEQIDQLYEIAKIDNISVIAYGLRTDFRTELFPGSKRLLEIVDNIEKIPTMCHCGTQAEFNCRMHNGECVFEGDQVATDGNNQITYVSLCGLCYKTEKDKNQSKPQQSDSTKQRILNIVKERV